VRVVPNLATGKGVVVRRGLKEAVEAKLRPEVHEPHLRRYSVGELAAHGEPVTTKSRVA